MPWSVRCIKHEAEVDDSIDLVHWCKHNVPKHHWFDWKFTNVLKHYFIVYHWTVLKFHSWSILHRSAFSLMHTNVLFMLFRVSSINCKPVWQRLQPTHTYCKTNRKKTQQKKNIWIYIFYSARYYPST